MLREVEPVQAFRTTPTGLYLFSSWSAGKRNVQFAFRALGIDENPALVIVGVQNTNFSLGAIRETGEFVLNVCSRAQVPFIDASRGLSGRDIADKFTALGMETVPATKVHAPMVSGCHANVECRVVNAMPAGNFTLFLAEALACHVDQDRPPVARLADKTYTLRLLAD
jgi:flavin reductase (DIM6/NTAB) family NADH-FMN oxidoreductase RutF